MLGPTRRWCAGMCRGRLVGPRVATKSACAGNHVLGSSAGSLLRFSTCQHVRDTRYQRVSLLIHVREVNTTVPRLYWRH